ncbi:MAG: zinc ABC transporter substrate-binding protein [Planctomycetaceae bacterium]
MFALFIAVVAGLQGCVEQQEGSGSSTPSGPVAIPYRIVCTTGMVTDIVREVAGERATVIGLLGKVDPHTYDPTLEDVENLLSADVVFYNGLHLEGQMQPALEKVGKKGKLVRAVASCLEEPPGFLRHPPEFDTHPDPHVWGDVSAWSRCVGYVAEVLAEYDPSGSDVYAKNATRYQTQLRELDDYAMTSIASIPADRRVLVTAHDAFGYFSARYGMQVQSVQGITTESEAGLDDVNRLVRFLVSNKIPSLFVEETVNSRNLMSVIEGAKAHGWTVSIGGSLYSDSMGNQGTYTGTYIGMMDHNITTIVRALGGTVPPLGLNGKLPSSD